MKNSVKLLTLLLILVIGNSAYSETSKEQAFRIYNERCVPAGLTNQWKEVITACSEAADLHPILPAIARVAYAYEQLKEWDNSISWYTKFLRNCPAKMRDQVLEKIELLKEVKKNGGIYPKKDTEKSK